jgi:hypothetical protein
MRTFWVVDLPASAAGTQKPEDLAAADGEIHAAHRRLRRLRIRVREPVDVDYLGRHARVRDGVGSFHESIPFYNFLFEEVPALLDRWYQRSGSTET